MANIQNSLILSPIIEEYNLDKDVKVWFAPSVIKIFKTRNSRVNLARAIIDEVDKVPADYIPYGVCNFCEIIFVYSSLWVGKEKKLLLEVELPDELKQIGKIELTDEALKGTEEEEAPRLLQ